MNLPTRGSTSSETLIEVTWNPLIAIADTGNSAILSYGLQWDSGTSGASWINLVGYSSDYLLTSFTISSGVAPGTTYRFKL